MVRGPAQPGGMQRYFLNLLAGLERIGAKYRVNDFRHAQKHPHETVGIVGKGHLLRERKWRNPILFGPAVFSHPLSDPTVFIERPIKRVLVSCHWLKQMYRQSIDVPVVVWPAGIDANLWKPEVGGRKATDFLIYDKVRWEHDRYEGEMIRPIREELTKRGLSFSEMRYGFYKEEDFRAALADCRGMIFLCEYETQGFAYLQTLASDIPILAWNRGGFWQDPEFYPHRIKFAPVSSVPYWDERCGIKFAKMAEFSKRLCVFMEKLKTLQFNPRTYILENLTLEKCAQDYVNIFNAVSSASDS